jgi:hypothetical protein
MWGMTEISPLGSLGVPTSTQIGDGLSKDELLDMKVILVLRWRGTFLNQSANCNYNNWCLRGEGRGGMGWEQS